MGFNSGFKGLKSQDSRCPPEDRKGNYWNESSFSLKRDIETGKKDRSTVQTWVCRKDREF